MTDTEKAPSKAEDKSAKTRKFVVREGCNIFLDRGNADGTGTKFNGGEVVELTAAEAKHFVKANAINPYVADEN